MLFLIFVHSEIPHFRISLTLFFYNNKSLLYTSRLCKNIFLIPGIPTYFSIKSFFPKDKGFAKRK